MTAALLTRCLRYCADDCSRRAVTVTAAGYASAPWKSGAQDVRRAIVFLERALGDDRDASATEPETLPYREIGGFI